MHTPLKPPRGTALQVASHVGPAGSIVVNTDAKTIHVQDGINPGGQALAKVGHQHAFNEVISWIGFTPLNAALVGVANGVAPLDADGKVPASFLPAGSGGEGGVSDAGQLLGQTLASNVIYSSLTTLGVLESLTVTDTISGSIDGNAGSADKLSTARLIALTGDATGSVSFDGSGDSQINVVLADVNASPVMDVLSRVTTNSKGQVIATSAATDDDIAAALGFVPVSQAYVDGVASNFTQRPGVRFGSTDPVGGTYNNGTDGTDATLTGTGALTAGGGTPSVGDRLALMGETNKTRNGIYKLTQANPWILTRDGGLDDIKNGAMVLVTEGTHAGEKWIQITANPITIGTSELAYTLFQAAATAYTTGPGIGIQSNKISNTGVLSVGGSTNQIVASAATGALTLSLAPSVTISGTMTAGAFSGSGAALSSLNAGALASGTVPSARLGSGTANSSSVLYGDNVWRVPVAPIPTALAATANVSVSLAANAVYVGANGSSAGVQYVNAAAAQDQKVWNTFTDNAGNWILKGQQDGSAAGNIALMFARSGTAATTMTANATTINLNGAVNATSFSGDGSALTNLGTAKAVVAPMIAGTAVADIVTAGMATNDYFRIRVGGSAVDGGWAEIATADGGNEAIYVRQYSGSFAFTTIVNSITLLDSSGNTSFPKTVTAAAFSGSGAGLSALSAASLTTGVVPVARLGSGTASATTVLYGDNTWKVPTVTGLTMTKGNILSNVWAGTTTGNEGYVYTGTGDGRFGFSGNAGKVDVYVDGNVFVAEGAQQLLSQVGFEALASVNGSKITALNAGNLATGTVPTARLGSGTANSGTALFGDGTWKAVSLTSLQGTGAANPVSTTTGTYVGVGSSRPSATFVHSGAPTDQKVWNISTGATNGTIQMALLPDAINSETVFLSLTRTGTTANLLTLTTAGINLAIGTTGLQLNGQVGTSGQVLTSNGAGAAPTWQTPAAGSSSLTATQVGFGSGSNLVSGSANFTFTTASNMLSLGNAAGTGILAGADVGSGNSAASALIVRAGNGTGSNNNPGVLTLSGGDYTSTNIGAGGNAILKGGNVTGSGAGGGGNVLISGGVAAGAVGGYVSISTSAASGAAVTERVRFQANGSWLVNGATGTAGQVLTSAGNAATPTWQTLVPTSVQASALVTPVIGTNSVSIGVGSDTAPRVWFINGGANTGQRAMAFQNTGAGGDFGLYLYADNLTTGSPIININRSANTATLITLTSTAVNLAGLTGGLQLNGSAGTAGQALLSNGAGAAPTWGTPVAATTSLTATASTPTPSGTTATTGVYGSTTGGQPTFWLTNSGGAADTKMSVVDQTNGGLLSFKFVNDAWNQSTSWLTAQRTSGSNTASAVTVTATAISLAGATTATTLNVTGATVPANGMYLAAANTLALSTGSAVALQINDTNAVGFGGANYGTAGQVLTSQGSGAAPTWTSGQTMIQATGSSTRSSGTNAVSIGVDTNADPFICLVNTVAIAGNKVTQFIVDDNGSLYGALTNDAISSIGKWMQVDRSANTATLITFTANAITLAGPTSTPSVNVTGSTVPANGMYLSAANTLAFSTGTAAALLINASNAIGLGGANYGTAGQVLTSQGPSATPTWTTPSAGGSSTTLSATGALTFSGLNATDGIFIGKRINTTGTPSLYFTQTTSAANERAWRFQVYDTAGVGTFGLSLVNDADNAGSNALVFSRSGNTVTTAAFTVQATTFSGTVQATTVNVTGTTAPANGMYLASAGILAFSTGSSVAMQINSSNAVGFAGANYGTAGQILQSNGNGAAPTWITNAPTRLSATASTPRSGTVNGVYAGIDGNSDPVITLTDAQSAANTRAMQLYLTNTGQANYAFSNDALSSTSIWMSVSRVAASNTANVVTMTALSYNFAAAVNSTTDAAGQSASLAASAGNGAGAGGAANLTAGSAGNTGTGGGGSVVLTAGAGSSLAGGGGNGGDVNLTAGYGGPNATGGNIRIQQAAVAATASSGFISVVTANGGTTSGNSGALTFASGTANGASGGNSGGLTIGTGIANGGNSGGIGMTTGTTTNVSGTTGSINIATGNATGAGGQAGSVTLRSGNVVSQNGAGITLVTGNNTGQAVSGALTFTTGNNATDGTGGYRSGNMNFTTGSAQGGDGTGGSGNFAFTSGNDTVAGNSGSFTFLSGTSATGTTGGVSLKSRDGTTNSSTGSHTYWSGNAPGTGNSGSIDVAVGSAVNGAVGTLSLRTLNATGTGTAGPINITAGAAVGGSNIGGAISLTAGNSNNGKGGNLNFTSGSSTTTTGSGGDINFTTGSAPNTTTGNFSVTTGSSNLGAPGSINLTAGNASFSANPFAGGAINITSGNGNAATSTITGGLLTIKAGNAGSGGSVVITAGLGQVNGGAGGNLSLSAGGASASGVTGGNVTIAAGAGGGSAVGGKIDFNTASTSSLVNSATIDKDGNFILQRVGAGRRIKEGTNAKMGTSTMVAGTVVVSNTSVTANSRIFLTIQSPGGTVGAVYIAARTAGTSFTITSTSASDTSVVAWEIVEPS